MRRTAPSPQRCAAPTRRRFLSGLAAAVAIPAACWAPSSPASGPTAVLVATPGAPVGELSNRDVRKLFLGFALERNGTLLEPVVNRTDPQLYEEFLQKVLFMSDGHYRRQVVSRVFRLGGRRPLEVSSLEDLVSTLQAQPGRLSFLWSHRADPALMQVVGALW